MTRAIPVPATPRMAEAVLSAIVELETAMEGRDYTPEQRQDVIALRSLYRRMGNVGLTRRRHADD